MSEDLIKKHYQVETAYAKKILTSKKGSAERARLLEKGYAEVLDIIKAYDRQGAVSHFQDFTFKLVAGLVKPGMTVLDYGCGNGELVYRLNKFGFKAYGYDLAEDNLKQAKKKLAELNKEEMIVQKFESQKDKYDLIVMDNVIEHFLPDEAEDILRVCRQALKNGGQMLVLTPHRLAGPHDISRNFLALGAKAIGFHFKEYTVSDLNNSMKQAGFSEVKGFCFHPRLFSKLNIFPKASKLALKKSLLLEKIFGVWLFKKSLSINRRITRALSALLFPSVIVAKK